MNSAYLAERPFAEDLKKLEVVDCDLFGSSLALNELLKSLG